VEASGAGEPQPFGCRKIPKKSMHNINQIIAGVSKKDKDWYNKNKWLIKILGLSQNQAAFQRGNIDGILGDIQIFYLGAKKFIAITLLILAVLCLTHSFIFMSTPRIFNLISIYFGLIGSFLASYGFILGMKMTYQKNQRGTVYMPDIPSHPEGFRKYCDRMNKIVANIINYSAEEKISQLKIELRRQFSLAFGFGMLVFSFCIQIVLEFVGR